MAARNPQWRETIRVGYSTAAISEAKAALKDIPNGLQRAIVASQNKTISKARTFTRKELLGLLTIKAANLKHRLIFRKATLSKSSASLVIMGREIGLINFKHTEDRRKNEWGTKASGTGVHVQIYRGDIKDPFSRAFIAKGNYGNVHIVQRRKPGGKIGTRAGRFPIDTKYSDSLYDMLKSSDIPKKLDAFIATDLRKQLDSQVDRFLRIKRT